VSGGATYSHELWDYSGDTVSVLDSFGNCLTYAIEQFKLPQDENRRLIGLYPIAYHPPYCYPVGLEFGLKRLRPTSNGINAIANLVDGTVSLSNSGSVNPVTIDIAVYDALMARRSESKHPVISDVERVLRENNVPKPSLCAPLLFQLLKTNVRCAQVSSTVVDYSGDLKKYQTIAPLVHEDGKDVGRAVAPSLVTCPAAVPKKSYNNDRATVDGRILSIANTKKPPLIWNQYNQELRELLVPIPSIGVPCSVEEIIELQNKPAQRGRSERAQFAMSGEYNNSVKAFIKAEAYGAITDPRNISTVETAHQLYYSTYTYPFKKQVLQPHAWFASTMTPAEIVSRVQELALYPHGVISSDYSRLDGHVSEDDKLFKESVYLRWVSDDHKFELKRILEQDRRPRGATSEGIKYDPGFSQLSGSPGTTNDNNLVTLRHDYIALRELGYSPRESWDLIELWVLGASDDRLRANIPGYAISLENVAAAGGHVLKSDIIPFGHPLVYLGRYYPLPHVCGDSVQDPVRTLSKLHISMAPADVSDEQALFNRAAGYLATDAATPIIGPWCRRVCELLTVTDAKHMTGDEHFRICQGPYPQDNIALLYEAVETSLGLEHVEVLEIETRIAAATSIGMLPQYVIPTEHLCKPKIWAVVGHSLVGPPPPETNSRAEESQHDSFSRHLQFSESPQEMECALGCTPAPNRTTLQVRTTTDGPHRRTRETLAVATGSTIVPQPPRSAACQIHATCGMEPSDSGSSVEGSSASRPAWRHRKSGSSTTSQGDCHLAHADNNRRKKNPRGTKSVHSCGHVTTISSPLPVQQQRQKQDRRTRPQRVGTSVAPPPNPAAATAAASRLRK
jgi:hypothetical protein